MRRVPVCVCDRRVLYPLVDGLMMPARISMPGDRKRVLWSRLCTRAGVVVMSLLVVRSAACSEPGPLVVHWLVPQ